MVYVNSRLSLFRCKMFGGNVALGLCCCNSFYALGKEKDFIPFMRPIHPCSNIFVEEGYFPNGRYDFISFYFPLFLIDYIFILDSITPQYKHVIEWMDHQGKIRSYFLHFFFPFLSPIFPSSRSTLYQSNLFFCSLFPFCVCCASHACRRNKPFLVRVVAIAYPCLKLFRKFKVVFACVCWLVYFVETSCCVVEFSWLDVWFKNA